MFVIRRFPANFHPSWRGDTPDEAGFGTDIRVVRHILRTLDEASAGGMDARWYRESENQFPLESILPRHAPDIPEGIRRCVPAGQGEMLVDPYHPAFFRGMTVEAGRASPRWAIHNPWGSGVADLQPRFVARLRPQEGCSPGAHPLAHRSAHGRFVLAER